MEAAALTEDVPDLLRIAEVVVADAVPALPVEQQHRLAVPVVLQRRRHHRLPVGVEHGDRGPVPLRIVPEGGHRFGLLLLGRAAADLDEVPLRVVAEVQVVPRHVADPDHVAGQLVVTVADHVAAAPVHNLAHLPQIRHVVPHEVVNRALASGKFRDVEHTGFAVVMVGRLLSQAIGQRHLSRLFISIRIVQHRVGEQTACRSSSEGALFLRRLTQRCKALRLAFVLDFQFIPVVAPRHKRQIPV